MDRNKYEQFESQRRQIIQIKVETEKRMNGGNRLREKPYVIITIMSGCERGPRHLVMVCVHHLITSLRLSEVSGIIPTAQRGR